MPALAQSQQTLIAQYNSHAQLAASHRLEAWKFAGQQSRHIKAEPVLEGDTPEKRLARAARFSGEAINGTLSSPSRGLLNGEQSVIDHAQQEKLRTRIDELIAAFDRRYEDDYCPEWTTGSTAHNDMLDILRELRKLREGIVASGREDDFAIAAYEKSVELAVRVRSHGEVNGALPYLVSVLHPARVKSERDELVKAQADLARLQKREAESLGVNSLQFGSGPPPLKRAEMRVQDATLKMEQTTSHRAYFASLLLLNHICLPKRRGTGGDGPSGPDFHFAYRDLTCPIIRNMSLEGKPMPDKRPSVYDDASFPPVPASSEHLRFAQRIHRAFLDADWPKLRRVLEAGASGGVTETQVLLVRALVERLRESVWTQATVINDKLGVDALVDRLLFDGWWGDGEDGQDGRDELDRFLRAKGWDSPALRDDRRVLLRLAPRDQIGTPAPAQSSARASPAAYR